METKTIRATIIAIVLLSLCVATLTSFGATYYKIGSDPGNTTSFEGNASSSVGWSITSGATKPASTP